MTYISWAAMYEGASDKAYLEVLLPRVIQEMVFSHGVRKTTVPDAAAVTIARGPIDEAAREICEAIEAFHLIFIHSDTGGRNLETGIDARSCAYCAAIHVNCDLPIERCIIVAPRHETEAWILADPCAVIAALGWRGSATSIGLPSDGAAAERLTDPKRTLEGAVREVRGRRRSNPHQLFAAIAQRQALNELRRAASFRSFEAALYCALADLGCVPHQERN
ncbi:MAG: hypothetical protein ACR65Z_12155 [Methylocystis sp.]